MIRRYLTELTARLGRIEAAVLELIRAVDHLAMVAARPEYAQRTADHYFERHGLVHPRPV